MNLFHISCSLLFHLITNILAEDLYEQEFFPDELDQLATIEHFLTGIPVPISIFGHAKVILCGKVNPPQFRLSNCETNLTLDYLMARTQHNFQRGVWYEFEGSAIREIEENPYIKDTMFYDYSAMDFFSVPVVKGPLPSDSVVMGADPSPLINLQPKANYVFMFAEEIGDSISEYTEEQIQAMSTKVKEYSGTHKIYVAFDVYYLSRTNVSLLNWKEYFPGAGVLFYSLENQKSPNLVDLKARIKKISEEKVLNMRFMVDYDLRTRYKSYLPTVEWQFYQDQLLIPTVDTCENPIDMLMVYQFIRNPREMRMVLLGDKNMDMVYPWTGPYPADILLQHLESGRNQRPLLMEFRNNEIIKTINFNRYSATPFVILPVVEGPNRPSDIKIPPIDSLIKKGMTANFVIGFVESTSGPEMGYSEKNILELVTSLTHPSVKKRKMGIRLQAKHLGHAKGVYRLNELCAVFNLKWIFVLDDCGRYSPSGEQLENLKFNLNLLCNHTIYLFVKGEIRRGLFRDETIVDPFPPETFTTPSTTTAITLEPDKFPTRTFPTKVTTLSSKGHKGQFIEFDMTVLWPEIVSIIYLGWLW